MRSHSYDFEAADVTRLIVPLLVPVAAFACLMHVLALLHLLPRPRPTLDVDRTIIVHKAEVSGSRSDAQIILLGDSSCLMNVSARQLSQEIGRPVLNLGTLSYLDLQAQATLLRRFAHANPNQVKAVVLLLHPEALRRPAPERYHTKVLESFLAAEDQISKQNVSGWLGLEIFRGRLYSRVLPTPLAGAYGRYYGFTSDMEKYLVRNRGSAVDPDARVFQGNAEYRLAPQLEAGSRVFKTAVPAGAKFVVGITPVPVGFAGRGHGELHQQMLAQWSQWLQAEVALEQLPPTLPDRQFSKTTHLNATGAATYTGLLAAILKSHLAATER
jgi:hypothetical protein